MSSCDVCLSPSDLDKVDTFSRQRLLEELKSRSPGETVEICARIWIEETGAPLVIESGPWVERSDGKFARSTQAWIKVLQRLA